MPTKTSLVFGTCMAAAACADAPPGAPEQAPSGPAAVAARAPVIGRLRTRDHVLTVLASGSGPRFSLSTSTGSLVADDIDPAELDRYEPELAAAYRNSVARAVPAVLDASLDPQWRAAGRGVLDKSDVGMHMRSR